MKTLLDVSRSFARPLALSFLLVFPLVSFLPRAQAETWYVRQEAVPNGDGRSWHNAFNNIQDAVDAANSSDQVFVKQGTYLLSATLSIVDKGPSIYGGFSGSDVETSPEDADPSANPTIIDGGNSIRCMYVSLGLGSFGAPLIDGFIIQNGSANYDGTFYDYGGGIWIQSGNTAFDPVVRNCVFIGNFAARGGGAVALDAVDATFVNCSFWKNSVDTYTTASFGGAVNIMGGTPVFTNCVFYANTARNGGAIYNASANVYLWNSILWGNTGWVGTQIYSANSPQTSATHLEYCNLQGMNGDGAYGGFFTTSIDTILSTDPKWAGPDGGNFHLRDTSPCIDTGSNNAPHLPAKDFEGDTRVEDGDEEGTATADMGVDEFVPGALTFGVWYVDASVSASGGGSSWATAKKTIEEAVTAAQAGDQVWVRAGTYSPAAVSGPFGTTGIVITKTIFIYGGFAGTETSLIQRDLAANPVVIKGIADAYTFDIRDTGQPYPMVLDGLIFEDTLYRGVVFTGQSGALITDCTFRSNITGIYGVAGTIRSCSFSGNKRGIYVSGWNGNTNTLIVDGCTFATNSNDLAGSDGGWGGGVHVGSYGHLAVYGSTFTGNNAVYGGAVSVYSNGTGFFTNCLFGGDPTADGNTAQYGGAVYGYGALNIQVAACTFHHNRAATSGGGVEVLNGNASITGGTYLNNSAPDGGGLAFRTQYGSYSRTVTGATFTQNSATGKGGGAFVESDSAVFSDCIFTGNSARWGGGLDGNGRVVNSVFSGNSAQYGGGAYFARNDLACDMVHCLFYENSATQNGGGIFSLYAFSATNSIFSNNSAGNSGDDVYNYYGNPMTISNCRISQSPFAGTNGNIDTPPQFVDAGAGNYRLMETSPCIDAGTGTPPGGLPSTDLQGNLRAMDADYDGVDEPDMGPYELQPDPVLPGDVDRSGAVDLIDAITALKALSGNPAAVAFRAADINQDAVIGLEEALYAMQKAAGLR